MRTVFSRLNPLALRTPALALAGAMLTLSAVPSQAVAAGGYSATLAAPLSAPKQAIIDSALWKCAGADCAAPSSSGRAVFTCQQVAKKFGEVTAFTAPAGALSAEDLAKCNKK